MVGHTHLDTYLLNNSMTNPEKPVVVSLVAGSVTTFTHMNPSFKVLDIDAKTMLPVNIHSYYIDLDDANATG